MRADYGLYIIAVICFIIAALPYYYIIIFPEEFLSLNPFTSTALTVIFAATGLIFAILGYSLRPKPIISIPEAPKPTLPPSPPPIPTPTEETPAAPPSEPAPPTPAQEKTAKPEKKKPKPKTRRKRTKKRRKKT